MPNGQARGLRIVLLTHLQSLKQFRTISSTCHIMRQGLDTKASRLRTMPKDGELHQYYRRGRSSRTSGCLVDYLSITDASMLDERLYGYVLEVPRRTNATLDYSGIDEISASFSSSSDINEDRLTSRNCLKENKSFPMNTAGLLCCRFTQCRGSDFRHLVSYDHVEWSETAFFRASRISPS